MPNNEDEHSVHREPHFQPGAPPPPDASEQRARRALEHERRRRSADDYRDGESVYDEPDIYPGRPPEVIDQDWSCDNCGYNLRGLPTGHPCPECGVKALYRPAQAGAASYQSWLQARVAAVTPRKAWTVAVLLALCGGPWAVLAVFMHTDPGMLLARNAILMVVVIGPVMEEMMKIAATAYVVEVRPYLFKNVEQLQLAAIGSALLFAAIENVLYLYVYSSSYTMEYALWRWTVCVALHTGCTLIASRGLVSSWRRAVSEFRPPKIVAAYKPLVTAIVIHSCYNAAAVLYDFIDP